MNTFNLLQTSACYHHVAQLKLVFWDYGMDQLCSFSCVMCEISTHFLPFDRLATWSQLHKNHSSMWCGTQKRSAKQVKAFMFYIWPESRHYSTWQHIMNCLRRQLSSDSFTSSLHFPVHPLWAKPRLWQRVGLLWSVDIMELRGGGKTHVKVTSIHKISCDKMWTFPADSHMCGAAVQAQLAATSHLRCGVKRLNY